MEKPSIVKEIEKITSTELTMVASAEEAMVYKNNTWYYCVDADKNVTGLNLHSGELTDDQIGFLKDLPYLQALNLTENKLTRFEFTGSMRELRVVDLSLNGALETVTFSGGLPKLERLDLSESGIKTLVIPKGFAGLTNLDIRKNALSDIVLEGDCPALVSLDLSENQLTKLSLPAGFGALKYLYLNDNQLEQLSFAAELPELRTLHLRGNQLKTLADDFLSPVPNLETLYLAKNPLPDTIKGFLEENEYRNCLEFIQLYFRELKKGKALDNECKVLLIGNGNVGKSCLVRRLVFDRFNPEWISTHGIALEQYKKKDFEYILNLWDFGGQDIYHATHRLFMQSNAVYLVLWDLKTENASHTAVEENGKTREYKNYSLAYWLDYAKSLGKGSPAVIVQTKSGRDGQQDRSDIRAAYSRQFSFFDIQHVELQEDDWDENGCNGLLISIRKAIKRIKPKTEIPKYWSDMRDWLRKKQQAGEKRLSLADYLEEAKNIEDPMGVLENWLTKTGVIFYRKGLFKNEIILDQEWAIEAIYTLLRREGNIYYEVLQARKGHFTGAYLAQVWKDNEPEEWELFISFMLSCDLCFETTEKDNRWRIPFEERSFVAPQLLPEEKPKSLEDAWLGRKGLFFRYKHDFLHDGVIQSFITRTQSLAEMRDIWRYGISLREEDQLALVEAQDKAITVQATENGKELLDKVRNMIEALQDCPGEEGVSVDGKKYVLLKDLKDHSRNNLEILCEDGTYEVFEKFHPFLGKDENAHFGPKISNMKEVRLLVSQGKLEQALEAFLHKIPSELEEELTQLQGRLSKLHRDERSGIVSYQEGNIERNKITRAILDLCSHVESDTRTGTTRSGFRTEPSSESVATHEPQPDKTKILFIAANPSNEARIQTDVEHRKLKNELLRGRARERFEFLQPQFAVTVSELIRAMNDKPQIVHFAGHGGTAGVFITDENNQALLMPLPALQRLFKPHQGQVQLVVLNACYSAEQGKEISKFGMFVVGNNLKITDPAAISFSEGLYNGLGEGKSFIDAFNDAMIVVLTRNPSAAEIIEVWKDGNKLDL